MRGAFNGPHRETTDLSGRVSRLMRRIHDPVHQVSMPRYEISGHVGLGRSEWSRLAAGPPKIGGEVCWAGRAKSSDTKWAILEKNFGLGQTSSKFAGICSDGIPKSKFFFGSLGTGARKSLPRARIRSDPDQHGCQRGPNLFGSRQTLGKRRAKFVRMAQHTSPPIFGGPLAAHETHP
jgi:hypothetical protein